MQGKIKKVKRVREPKFTVAEVDTEQHLNWPTSFKKDLEDMLMRQVPPHMIIKHAFAKYALVIYRFDVNYYRKLHNQRLLERENLYKTHYKHPKPVVTIRQINLPDEPLDTRDPYRLKPAREEHPTLLTAQSDQCRWIEGELPYGERHLSRCCGKPVHRQSYCKEHAKRAFLVLTPEQRRDLLRRIAKPPKDGY